jgi:hypothetical protein
MKILFVSFTVAAALAGCAAPGVPVAPMGSLQGQVQSPKLVTGQQWTYRRLDLWRNEEAERFSQSFTTETNGKWAVLWTIHSSKDETRIGTTEESFSSANHGFGDPRMSGQYEPLRFPLSVGKTWTFNYKFQSKPETLIDVTQTAVVSGWETVTVPAGTFKALRIDHSAWYGATENSKMWKGRITETFWYAPSAQRIVAQEYKDTTGRGVTWDQRRDELVSMSL